MVEAYRWEFKARFRRGAFGWKSQPAMTRVKEAVAEITQVARRDPMPAAEGAVTFIERLSPALEHVDGSSGAIGNAVCNAIDALVPIIAGAPADAKTRERWMERLWAAHEADETPWIEELTEHWGELCASADVASAWADRLLAPTRKSLMPDKTGRTFFDGTTACLSALFAAQRYDQIIDLLQADDIWAYKRWAVKALAATGNKSEALRYAESCRSPYGSGGDIDAVCEQILLSSGLEDEAYQRYGLAANQRATYLATFRAVAKKYPNKPARQILADLVATTPGNEGKWFAAAKEAGLYDEALALAERSPCDPKTLTRAARDYAQKEPAFATAAGLLAIRWLVEGYGYEITSADVEAAYQTTITAAQNAGTAPETRASLAALIATERPNGFVRAVLDRHLTT